MKYYIQAIKKSGDYKTRASRSEYWLFILTHFFVMILLTFFMSIIFNSSGRELGSLILYLFFFVMLIPHLALTVRRLHDSDRSGVYIFSGFIPIVGPFVMLYFLTQPSTIGINEYGPEPIGF